MTDFLPRYKLACRNLHKKKYVYKNDSNELVVRLGLIVEEGVSNMSHTSEIRSIVDELNKAGYVYKRFF